MLHVSQAPKRKLASTPSKPDVANPTDQKDANRTKAGEEKRTVRTVSKSVNGFRAGLMHV